jgi:hypothetical protein
MIRPEELLSSQKSSSKETHLLNSAADIFRLTYAMKYFSAIKNFLVKFEKMLRNNLNS